MSRAMKVSGIPICDSFPVSRDLYRVSLNTFRDDPIQWAGLRPARPKAAQ